MSERTTLQTMSGATVAISATQPLTFDAAGYADTDLVFSTIGQAENFGEHGVTAQITAFTAINDAVVQKFKGSKDYGTMNFVLGNLPSDSGQDLLDTASESTNRYSLKITYPLGQGEVTPEIHYLDVLVASATFQDGSVNDVRKRAVALAVCRRPTIVAAT
jgi:hypothetical protein